MNPFAALSKPRQPVTQPKKEPRYQRFPLVDVVQPATSFNTQIATRAQSDRTNAIRGKGL